MRFVQDPQCGSGSARLQPALSGRVTAGCGKRKYDVCSTALVSRRPCQPHGRATSIMEKRLVIRKSFTL
jgi:hypothetical protein